MNENDDLKASGLKMTLDITHPHLAKEWHPTKNALPVSEVKAGSNLKVWWLCSKDKSHEWEACPNNRSKTNGTKCPYCTGRKVNQANSLASTHPIIAAEWHPTKNAPVTIYDVSHGSKFKAWWKCPKGDDHIWKTSVNHRSTGQGCPVCLGRTVAPSNCLATTHPEVIDEWDYTVNHCTPNGITAGSNTKVWWICRKDKTHKWRATVNSRTQNRPTGCPICANQVTVLSNSVITTHPELLVEWHPIKNHSSKLADYTFGSNFKAWWICRWGHEWQASIRVRSKGHGCPKCNFRSSRLEVRMYSELQHIFPDAVWQDKSTGREIDIYIPSLRLAFEIDGWYWHNTSEREDADSRKRTLLCDLGITLIRVYDNRIKNVEADYSISYKNGEEDINVIHRTIAHLLHSGFLHDRETIHRLESYIKLGKYCGDLKFSEIISVMPGPLADDSFLMHPLVCEWHPSKNLLRPEQLSCGSKSRVWWLCAQGHEWQASLGSRAKRGLGCPYCSSKLPSKTNNLLVKNPELAKEWHATKNKIKPLDVLPNSGKKIWWVCAKGHEWEATVSSRNCGSGCPFCWSRIAHKDYSLALTNPELISQWHPNKNGTLTPFDVTPRSGIKVWWRCEKDHEWLAAPVHRSRGHGCHYCSGQKVTVESCLASTHPKILEEWDFENNIISPNDVSYGSTKKVWWKCSSDHNWQAVIKNRTKPNPTNCPQCWNDKHKKSHGNG